MLRGVSTGRTRTIQYVHFYLGAGAYTALYLPLRRIPTYTGRALPRFTGNTGDRVTYRTTPSAVLGPADLA